MKRLLLTIVILCGLTGSVVAQKKSTIFGELVIGEVVQTDETTREITIKYRGKEGTEVFSGILKDGYKLKMSDGRLRELKVNEIMPGIRVRLFYKSDHEQVSGQKKKINRIFRVDFLGRDEFVRLRDQLNVDPSTAVAHAENADLPSVSPLKVYLAIALQHVKQSLVNWISKWNQKNGDSFGKLELVSDLRQADVLIVVALGSDTMVAELPFEAYEGDRVIKARWSHATSYVVVKDAEGLKVLWTGVAPMLTTDNTGIALKATESLISEIEKRMKAKTRKVKKDS